MQPPCMLHLASYIDCDNSKRSYLVIQAARVTGTVQYKYRMQLIRCVYELTSAIYCIAWSFFSLQQAKTYNSQKYQVTEWKVCT